MNSLIDRFHTKDPSKRRAAYIYSRPDTSTFRYRVSNMIQALSCGQQWEGCYFFENELEMAHTLLPTFDVVVFVRTPWTIKIQNFLAKVRSEKIPVLFDVDDLVFDLSRLPLVMNSLRTDLEDAETRDYWFSYCSRIWLVGSQADGFLTTNPYLQSHLERVFNKPAYSVPNFLNHEQIDLSHRIYLDRGAPATKGSLSMGYFSGTPSHANDFRKIVPELTSLLTKNPKLSLHIVGFMDMPPQLSPFVDSKQIQHHPLVDFLTLQKLIGQVDINLVPLIDNEFTNCKSELKFFEASIVGTVTCASPTFTYSNAIQDEVTGYLCREGEWETKIQQFLEMGISPQVIKEANHYCLKHYSPQAQKDTIHHAFSHHLYCFKSSAVKGSKSVISSG